MKKINIALKIDIQAGTSPIKYISMVEQIGVQLNYTISEKGLVKFIPKVMGSVTAAIHEYQPVPYILVCNAISSDPSL